jgi:NADH:ubiquinone oxidoreductase subunit
VQYFRRFFLIRLAGDGLPMGFLVRVFTWWNSATFGTWLMTRFRGLEVGTDEFGNRYYTERNGGPRRWVVYAGEVEGSQVPPQWNAWLHHTVDEVPAPESRRPWERPHEPNPTGTADAYHPKGSTLGLGERSPTTGDYEPWRPA